MATSTLTSKGQITIPQSVREALGLQAGDKVDFVREEPGTYKCRRSAQGRQGVARTFAGRVGRPVSIEQMADAVAAEVAQRARRKPAKRIKRG